MSSKEKNDGYYIGEGISFGLFFLGFWLFLGMSCSDINIVDKRKNIPDKLIEGMDYIGDFGKDNPE